MIDSLSIKSVYNNRGGRYYPVGKRFYPIAKK